MSFKKVKLGATGRNRLETTVSIDGLGMKTFVAFQQAKMEHE